MSVRLEGGSTPGGWLETNFHDNYSIYDMEHKVINNNVLYAEKIDVGKYEESLDTALKDISKRKEAVEAALKVVEESLAATQSKRYFSNEEAQAKREKLHQILEALNQLESHIKALSQNGEILAKIKEYNNCLPQLKKGAEITLLRKQAERINKAYKEVKHWEETEYFFSDPSPYTEDTSDKMYRIEHTYYFISYDADSGRSKYIHKYSKHEYINYWGLIKMDGFPWNIMDDDIATLKKKIRGLGYILDYRDDEIVKV